MILFGKVVRVPGAQMKSSLLLVMLFSLLFGMFALSGAGAMPMSGAWSDNGKKSPAAAALLSLIPVPLAIGQFYDGDWSTGLLFSFLETAEMGTMIGVAVYEGGSMMYGGVPIRKWDGTGQAVFFSSLASFVLTKFTDAFTAALIADEHNANLPANVSLVVRDGALGLSLDYKY